MAVLRKRLIFWLIKAYIKRWGKVFLLCFFLGLFIFSGLAFASKYLVRFIPAQKKLRIGVIGAYTAETLPSFVINDISQGLTKIENDGTVHPDIAEKWEVKDSGKTYTFLLRKDKTFSDGSKVTSKDINYNFANVKIDRKDPQTITFHLKDAYSPFLVTTARPIFKKGYIGIGEYKLSGIHLNGSFVESVNITSTKNKYFSETFVFYPSEEALKHAFVLGEVTEARGITNEEYRGTTFTKFPNIVVTKQIDYARMVSLFFNTQDPFLSDKKVRNALSYAIPNTFLEGERTHIPYSPTSIYLNREALDRAEDISHAKLLIDAATVQASSSAQPKVTIKAAPRYLRVAGKIAEEWKKIGIQTTIEESETIPTSFQIYLGDFSLPRDPDQYVLWHSTSPNNITRLRSQRLDKLLEDGRKITDIEERKKIYEDFQKYLLDESPAAFLYFPYDYVITRN